MKTCLFILLMLGGSLFSNAQIPASSNSADIYLQLKKLNILGSVLYIAAHPDDENTRLLAYLSKEKSYKTGYLSLTRGDGGQNLIGNEQGVELGLIRTQELLSARRIDGAEQFFSRAYDFGFSKSADEAMRIWNKEKILSDVVWIIRSFQPDVIITRFPGDERAGHGHHAASAILANEAFTAAANPARFPEQLNQGVKPWQARRILWNTFNFGSTNTTAEDQFKIDVGAYNPLLGKGYGEIASESRSQHKSQGFGVPRQRGISMEYFKTTGGSAPQKDLMDSIVTDWTRVGSKAFIGEKISAIIAAYSFEHPEKSLPALMQLYHLMESNEGGWMYTKQKEIRQIIEACSGLYVEGSVSQPFAVLGDSLKINLTINKRNNCNIIVQDAAVWHIDESAGDLQWSKELSKTLNTNENLTESIMLKLPENTPVTQPYWLKYPMSGGAFTVEDHRLTGKAQSDPAYIVRLNVVIEGVEIKIDRPIQYKYTDPVKGELFQPLVVMPKITVQQEYPLLVETKDHPQKIKVKYKANTALQQVSISMNEHILVNNVNAMAKGAEQSFETSMSSLHTTAVMGSLVKDTFTLDANQPALYPVFIRYDHIPNITYFKPAVQTILSLDVKIAGKKIGYITGAGDKIPEALEQMGYTVTKLSEQDMNATVLQQYDAVITGVRAYNVNSFLFAKYNEMMAYIRNGGNLIVQYNTTDLPVTAWQQIGPYPFKISRSRITDENAEAHIDLPNHPVFNYPNKITAKDFESWVQERSIYQAEQIDSNYAAPISMADPGEKPSSGSLIVTRYGKGNFVYTGLVFFRELPAGVAGAYRLMANLIALKGVMK